MEITDGGCAMHGTFGGGGGGGRHRWVSEWKRVVLQCWWQRWRRSCLTALALKVRAGDARRRCGCNCRSMQGDCGGDDARGRGDAHSRCSRRYSYLVALACETRLTSSGFWSMALMSTRRLWRFCLRSRSRRDRGLSHEGESGPAELRRSSCFWSTELVSTMTAGELPL